MAFLDFLKNLFKKKEPPPTSPGEAQTQEQDQGPTVTPPVQTPADPNSGNQ